MTRAPQSSPGLILHLGRVELLSWEYGSQGQKGLPSPWCEAMCRDMGPLGMRWADAQEARA